MSSAALSRIRLMVDYCAPFPVWGTYLRVPDHFVLLGPGRNPLGLSRDLIRDLIEWQRSWDRQYDPIDGWDNPAHARRHREVGADLYRRLREETGRDDITWE
ncbi:hypothetical protein GS457_07500 [Rhodococcus hoagii]|uniref:hypothetical protein n=1 Tax=Prescottella TaxID=2979332 RepID=UPI00111BFE07|nr:hypothetical protein [Prescottella equi]MBM4484957.1 hypothetical protein [Prescottella equi]MBM4518952.1 hypothetical protein [Prescottella equi]MBM4530736.1 hypothetical protein [Prescottella equi]MBM4544540.1 hypothetical protein [Prescottella equi]MBM4570561.1 hypothetical protein [Prescottella equi]